MPSNAAFARFYYQPGAQVSRMPTSCGRDQNVSWYSTWPRQILSSRGGFHPLGEKGNKKPATSLSRAFGEVESWRGNELRP